MGFALLVYLVSFGVSILGCVGGLSFDGSYFGLAPPGLALMAAPMVIALPPP